MFRERTSCRAGCNAPLAEVLSLGKTALANDFLKPGGEHSYRNYAPLTLNLCPNCSFVQLREVVDPEILYSNYAYVSSTSRTMDAHLETITRSLLEIGEFTSAPKVLEIASNTGLFLKKFQAKGATVLGVEPAANISAMAVQNGVPTRTEFFNASTAAKTKSEWGAADLIVGRHVFAHIDDLSSLIEALDKVSHERTLIAFEVPYALDFFDRTEFDTIYHEHLSYISVGALSALFAGSPFELHRIDRYPIHGGSILFMLSRRGSRTVHASISNLLAAERERGLSLPASWKSFAERVGAIRSHLPALVRSIRAKGKTVVGYGASAKGNTLLQSCGLGAADLDYIIDNTPFKQGKLAPGSWIPVVGPERLLQDRPDYALLLAWNFAPEIVAREQEYQRAGGRFIVPIPEPRVLSYPNEFTLRS